MKNKKILVLSALGAFVGASGLVGGTYAIFTSEAKTDISITSGKVSVSAEISNLKMYSGAWNGDTGKYDSVEVIDTFTNGGTASLSEGTLLLSKISPMDKVTFRLNIENNSNVITKQRIKIRKTDDTGLFEALEVEIDGVPFAGNASTEWEITQPGEGSVTKEISVMLPENADSKYQDKTCKISFAVEALQSNAHTCEHEKFLGYIYNETTGVLTSKVCEDCGDIIDVTNEDVQALAGKILVKHSSDEYYTITNKTMIEEFAGQTEAVNFILGGGADIYNITGPDSGSYKANIYGLKNGNEYLTKVYSSNGEGIRMIRGTSLTIKHLEMVGTTAGGWYRGIQAVAINYYDCHFTGGTTNYCVEVNYTDCTFDSTNINNGGKADYSVYCYNTRSKFTNCKFVSAGKAVKIYSEYNHIGNKYEFINCDFAIGDQLLTSKSDKAAIQIDSNYQTVENPYVVVCEGCTQVDYDGGLAQDSSTKSEITIK